MLGFGRRMRPLCLGLGVVPLAWCGAAVWPPRSSRTRTVKLRARWRTSGRFGRRLHPDGRSQMRQRPSLPPGLRNPPRQRLSLLPDQSGWDAPDMTQPTPPGPRPSTLTPMASAVGTHPSQERDVTHSRPTGRTTRLREPTDKGVVRGEYDVLRVIAEKPGKDAGADAQGPCGSRLRAAAVKQAPGSCCVARLTVSTVS